MSWTREVNDWAHDHPLFWGDYWLFSKMSENEIKIERTVSVSIFHAKEESNHIVVTGKNMMGRKFTKKIPKDNPAQKLIELLRTNCGGRV